MHVIVMHGDGDDGGGGALIIVIDVVLLILFPPSHIFLTTITNQNIKSTY